jgi:hypothetical protein
MLNTPAREDEMPRLRELVPQGVIPAALLPFTSEFAIDEAAFRHHLGDLAAPPGGGIADGQDL